MAGYLVMKRASIEPNFHSLYLSFMDTLSSLSLRRSVLRETYRNIKVYNIPSQAAITTETETALEDSDILQVFVYTYIYT